VAYYMSMSVRNLVLIVYRGRDQPAGLKDLLGSDRNVRVGVVLARQRASNAVPKRDVLQLNRLSALLDNLMLPARDAAHTEFSEGGVSVSASDTRV
jgi:hypothetical protein